MTDLDEFAEQIDALSHAALTPMDDPLYLTDRERDLLRDLVVRYLADAYRNPYLSFDARRYVTTHAESIRRKLGEDA
jgi:hypothetical protein